MKIKTITSCCALAALTAATTQAASVVGVASATNETTFVASTTDLGAGATITRTSGGVFTGINGGNASQLINGSSASGAGLFHSSGTNGTHFPATYTIDLDISTNTLGYNISGINSLAGWNENGRTLANQQILVEYSLVGSAAFTAISDSAAPGGASGGVISYTPFSTTQGASSSQISITDDSGLIASGVDSIRITVQDHGTHTGGAQGTVFKEFDVIGTASIPEPSSTALLGLSGLALILRRKRA